MVNEYVGGYDDWLRQRDDPSSSAKEVKTKEPVVKEKKESVPVEAKKKLSYNDQRELELLPAKIEMLEQEQSDIHEQMALPEFFSGDNNEIAKTQERLAEIDSELSHCYERWENLD